MNPSSADYISPNPHSRRLGQVKISVAALADFVTTCGPTMIRCEGLPKDARFVRLFTDSFTNDVYAVFEHASFSLCGPRDAIETLYPQWTSYHGEIAATLAIEQWKKQEPLFISDEFKALIDKTFVGHFKYLLQKPEPPILPPPDSGESFEVPESGAASGSVA